MGKRKKVITNDCVSCEKMEIDYDSQMICHWSRHNPKILDYPKGKRPKLCKLIKKGDDLSAIY
jgi:hypothetical protein